MDPTSKKNDKTYSLVDKIKQSPPVDVTQHYDTSRLAGKTILITGGASGLGAACARLWASHGAHIVIGDRVDSVGTELVAELRTLPGSSGQHYYQHCDVTKWEDQVALFQFAAACSPTGGINVVVANAGVAEQGTATTRTGFEWPRDMDSESPLSQPPDLKVIDVNIRGVLYTTHLAMFWLPRNGGRPPIPGTNEHEPEDNGHQNRACRPVRDRHILLVGSIGGLIPLPGNPLYSVTKHAVTGLFRSLRGTVWAQGVRCNLICPYFVETPLLPRAALALLAGGGLAEIEDVVDAATRLTADESIVGRALVIGPKMQVVDGEGGEVRMAGQPGETESVVQPVAAKSQGGGARTQAVWEAYADDYLSAELFVRRYVGLLNLLTRIRGWIGFWKGLWRTLLARPVMKTRKISVKT